MERKVSARLMVAPMAEMILNCSSKGATASAIAVIGEDLIVFCHHENSVAFCRNQADVLTGI
jgi:hypothetical protein